MSGGVNLFSVVSPGSKEDESEFVNACSDFLEAPVHKYSLAPNRAEDIFYLLQICNIANDGPVSSFSSILFYKLMEIAVRNEVTVVLTGQGADEVFCGYRKYPLLEAKRLLAKFDLLGATRFMGAFLMRGTLLSQFSYAESKRYWGDSNTSILGSESRAYFLKESMTGTMDTISDRQLMDIERYSVPYLCHYEDRMSMAHSREVRSPFLDYRVVELGLRMPTELKMNAGWTKYALRRAFEDWLPREIIWRKDKKGFSNPQDEWFGVILRQQVLDIMSDAEAAVYRYGLVDRVGYLDAFRSYCAGNRGVWFRDVFAPFSLNVWLNTLPS